MWKLTGMSHLNVRAIEETMSGAVEQGHFKVTGATVIEVTVDPTTALQMVRDAKAKNPGRGHPGGSLNAVIRKVEAAQEEARREHEATITAAIPAAREDAALDAAEHEAQDAEQAAEREAATFDVVNDSDGIARVHKAGCRDAKRAAKKGASVYTATGETQDAVIADVWQDIIAENDGDMSHVRGATEFAPCVGDLPEGREDEDESDPAEEATWQPHAEPADDHQAPTLTVVTDETRGTEGAVVNDLFPEALRTVLARKDDAGQIARDVVKAAGNGRRSALYVGRVRHALFVKGHDGAANGLVLTP